MVDLTTVVAVASLAGYSLVTSGAVAAWPLPVRPRMWIARERILVDLSNASQVF